MTRALTCRAAAKADSAATSTGVTCSTCQGQGQGP